ncbi:FliI/YscN family ATPase [Yoonia sp. F2084L]|uniref:FliI/YscN family ATPase n=1 Tax=Yoonia sp. F2084L TaxID=2926419 RepID=UPI001FF5233D|nr:FliI/YscN family ATPase [Yoonia sp. F2084L]
MQKNILDQMQLAISSLRGLHAVGRVIGVAGGTVQARSSASSVRLGDRAQVCTGHTSLSGEIVKLDQGVIHILIDGDSTGISIDDRVILDPPPTFAPHACWIGRVIDPDGKPLDGRPLLPGDAARGLNASPPGSHARRAMGQRLETGLAVFNTLLPIVRGQRMGLFAGSGVGKSTLLADMARGMATDVIVIALVGERGREVRHFVENVLGPEGMQRAVVVAATSDRAPQVRRRCAGAAMAVAEHFRDQGKQVLLLIDSVTRFCEAHREVAVAGGEHANLRGFPASTGAAVAQLCERAGPGVGMAGDITAIFSVLVAGSDMEEPIADMLRGMLDGHVVLDRGLAEKGQFPAVDVVRSVSRSLPDAATVQENAIIANARRSLGTYAEAELMIQSGLYVAGSDPQIDAAIQCAPALNAFLMMKDQRGTLAHFAKLRQALASGPMQHSERPDTAA